jgi:DNA-binding CsgD family transcriptional regulator
VSASHWDTAQGHLRAAEALSPPGRDRAIDINRQALAAEVAIGREDVDRARQLAEAAYSEALDAGLPEQMCQALEVLGRCYRRSDLDAAEDALERARQVAETHGLIVWQIRATHELGGVDLVGGRGIERMDDAAGLARQAGALGTAVAVDLHRAFWFFEHHHLDDALITARQCADAAIRFRMDALAAFAHAAEASVYAIRGQGEGAERAIGVGARLAGVVNVGDWVATWYLRALFSFHGDDRERALRELDRADELFGGAGGPVPYRGQWALLHALAGSKVTAEVVARVRASAAAPHFVVRSCLDYVEAVAAGRAGDTALAGALATAADQTLAPAPWFRHLARRLIAEVAMEDGWGEPMVWLREAFAFFDAEQQAPLATACRSLLARAGDEHFRRRRPPADLPGPLAALGITRRELDVLELLADGRSTREIADQLYLSPKTVERHIANLAVKAGVAGRAQLVAFAASWAARRPN